MKGYFHPVQPEKHPLYERRNARAVTRERLGGKIRFVALRGFETDTEGKLLDIAQTIDVYTKEFSLCDVIWPVYPTLFAPNFEELVEEVKKRDMFLFDFWGYVPGSNPDRQNIWGEYTPPDSAVKALYEKLGEQFIGFDNGEQDGRYIGSFAPLMCPASGSRKELYKNFCRHFEKLEGHMKNDISLLASLHFLHYFAKGGNTILLGAETAQALPNVNVWFSYIRGAGKQYGLLWFGNASVWNRWGWKEYSKEDDTDPYEECGPECGTSLSLLKRLLYTEYMYGSDLLGFESGWLLEENHMLPGCFGKKGTTHNLSPIGIIQENMTKFVERHPRSGVMYTPLCLYMDFYNGFVPPRHLYSKDVCRVWGNRSYEQGDYQTHGLFSMLYPHYENAGFFRDEEGFLTATPYGDIADVIFSDTEEAVLNQYELILTCGEGVLDAESRDKLLSAAKSGNRIVLFSGKLAGADSDFLAACGIASLFPAEIRRDTIRCGETLYPEESFALQSGLLKEGVEVLATSGAGEPVLLCTSYGAGEILTFLLPYGLTQPKKAFTPSPNGENVRIAIPQELHPAVVGFLAEEFHRLPILRVDNPALQYSVNLLDSQHLTLLVCNNSLHEESFSIQGEGICDVIPWEISDISSDCLGYTPKRKYLSDEGSPTQSEGDHQIEALSVQIYEVSIKAGTVSEKPEMTFSSQSKAPLFLSLPEGKSIQDAYWELPWFDRYFSGFKVNARDLERWDTAFLKAEGEFAKLHKLDLILDFSSLLNHYPDLSLIRNIPGRTEESLSRIASILEKGKSCGCTKAVFTIHRNAENVITLEQANENMRKTLAEIASLAKEQEISVYMQNGRSLERTVFAKSSAAYSFAEPGFGKVYNLSHGIGAKEDVESIVKEEAVSGVFLSVPKRDCFGQYSDLHLPLCKAEENLGDILSLAQTLCAKVAFVCLDAHYESNDELYADIKALSYESR